MAKLSEYSKRAAQDKAPKFSCEDNGSTATISTSLLDEKRDVHDPGVWDDQLILAGMDPEDVRVIPPVQVRQWDSAIGNGKVRRMFYYKFNVEYRTRGLNVSAAVASAKRAAFTPKAAPAMADTAYVVALGDLQLGKALADYTAVRTVNGWCRHGDLVPGDYVYSPVTGEPVEVKAVTGSTAQLLYRVTLGDHTYLDATADHGFVGRYAADLDCEEPEYVPYLTQTVKQIMEQQDTRGAFRLRRTAPVQLDAVTPSPWYRTDREQLLSADGHRDAHLLSASPAEREQAIVAFLQHLDEQNTLTLASLQSSDGELSDTARLVLAACQLQGWRPVLDTAVDHTPDEIAAALCSIEHDDEATEWFHPRWGSTLDVVSIEPVGIGHAQCITVEGGEYLAGESFISTHNCDGDGVEGTARRFIEKSRSAVEEYVATSRGAEVHIVHLGDCIEGFVSQGGANTFRTTLTTTEQVDLYEHLLLEQIKMFADVAPRVTVTGVPGNHDEAVRPVQKYTDSWAVQSLKSLERALSPTVNPNFRHVHFQYPDPDELVVVFDVAGLTVAAAHGHKFPRGPEGYKKWWEAQSFGNQPVAEASLLLAGHKHHLFVTEPTRGRMFIQVPALESDSVWFRHQAGVSGSPGIVTFRVTDGKLPGMWSKL